MNKERLEQLADHIETLPPNEFDMGVWGPCGCIGGHAEALFGNGMKCLGLTRADTSRLFVPKGWWKHDSPVRGATPKQAAAVIRNLIATGKVEWEKFV